MNHRLRLSGLVGAATLLVAFGACSSAPTRLHALSSLTPTHGAVAYAGPPVRVDAVHLPPDMDRSEITTRTDAGGIEIHDLDLWAAPLSKLARQTLTADLIARLPSGKVVVAPLDKPEGALGLNVVILEFSRNATGVQWVASWQASAGGSSSGENHLITLDTGVARTPSAVADRISKALAEIADDVAARLSSAGNTRSTGGAGSQGAGARRAPDPGAR
jgi:uncharacterized lipoprotein YmbA